MDNKISEIIELLKQQNIKIDNLNKRIEQLELYGNRMDNHITFIEFTYKSLIKPINCIKSYFSNESYYISNS
jgi:hypothetical protein